MRKFLYLVFMALTVLGCSQIDRYPLGDDFLVVVDNKTKGTQGLEFNGEYLLPPGVYTEFELVDYSHNWSQFIAKGAVNDLYEFYSVSGKVILEKIFSDPEIMFTQTEKGCLFVGTRLDGRKEVLRKKGNVIVGPFDDVFPSSTGFIY